jgi:methionyl-tRNA formyltransferase
MQMDAGLDTGPMIEVAEMAITPRDTAGTLTTRLAAAGARAIVDVLARLARDGRLPAAPQPADGVTYAAKIDRAEAVLDWALPATVLDRVVRAFDPVPGATTACAGEALKVWDALPLESVSAVPGTVLSVSADGVDVACGSDALRLRTVQPAGGKRMPARAFAVGRGLEPGATLGPPA